MAISGFFNNYPIDDYIIVNDCALIEGKSDRKWKHLIASNIDELNCLLEKIDLQKANFYGVENWVREYLELNHHVEKIFPTMRYIFPHSTVSFEQDHEVNSLISEDADHIYSHSDYKDVTPVHYIEERIQNGISSGIRLDGVLVAWGITHDDGALGFLNVLPEYRMNGLARSIMINMISQVLKQNKTPFANIVIGNEAPMRLVETFGFKYDRPLNWVQLK